MGEQRFTIQKASGMYLHLPIFDKGVEMADGDVCILLNEQQSTISALKEENDILKQKLRKNYIANKQYEEMKRLQEENEQLKKENQRVYGIIEDGGVLLTRKQLLDVIGEDKCDMFFREQETSNKLQEIKDLLSEADLFSDKATEHDIIAYSEMRDFDNKDAYSIACAIAMIKKELNDE